MSVLPLIALRLRAFRHQRGMSQEAVAELAELSHDAVSTIERGVRLPSIDALERIATATGVEVGDFFAPDGDQTSRRAERAATAVAIVRSLDDADLEVAITQLSALAGRRVARE